MEHEEAELLADLAVVALLGFLEALQVLVELLLREERRAVDALHRLVLRVALPVGVRRVSSLNAFSRFVDGTCGPTQKSTNVSRSLIV